jgi:hypothetical protein
MGFEVSHRAKEINERLEVLYGRAYLSSRKGL